jgi:hypothetical protein
MKYIKKNIGLLCTALVYDFTDFRNLFAKPSTNVILLIFFLVINLKLFCDLNSCLFFVWN